MNVYMKRQSQRLFMDYLWAGRIRFGNISGIIVIYHMSRQFLVFKHAANQPVGKPISSEK